MSDGGSRMDVVTIGETMALLSAPSVGRLRDARSLTLSAAGSESNVAIGLSRLGYRATWIGRVGRDELGELIRTTLRAEGVDVSRVVVDPDAPTALMFKERRSPNVVRVSYYRRGYAGSHLCVEDLDEPLIASARLLHVTGITPALSPSARSAVERAVEVARSSGVLVSFDFNYRSALWSRSEAAGELSALARSADLVFAGEEELSIVLDGDPLGAAAELAGEDRTVVVKRGAKGAVAVDSGGVREASALEVVALDPVGAGDAFVAGYLASLLDGAGPDERLAMGCSVGAFVVAAAGDWEGLPTREDLALLTHPGGTTLR